MPTQEQFLENDLAIFKTSFQTLLSEKKYIEALNVVLEMSNRETSYPLPPEEIQDAINKLSKLVENGNEIDITLFYRVYLPTVLNKSRGPQENTSPLTVMAIEESFKAKKDKKTRLWGLLLIPLVIWFAQDK